MCVLGVCAAVPTPALCPFLPRVILDLNETELSWGTLPPFYFQTPLDPLKEKKERKEKKQRRKKKDLTIPIGSPRQAFLHKGKNEEKSPKTGIFSEMDTCYILCRRSCLYITSLNPHNPGGGYCYYLLQGPLWSSTRRSHKIQIGCPWLHLEWCRDKKCRPFLLARVLIGDHTASRTILWPTQVTGKWDYNWWELPDLEAPMSQIL